MLEGRLLVDADHDGAIESTLVGKDRAFVVPRSRWHRLRVVEPGRLLFFTPTVGTMLRPIAEATPAPVES